MGAFSNIFDTTLGSGISSDKAASVAAATAEKQQRLNPESIRNFQYGLDQAVTDHKSFSEQSGLQ